MSSKAKIIMTLVVDNPSQEDLAAAKEEALASCQEMLDEDQTLAIVAVEVFAEAGEDDDVDREDEHGEWVLIGEGVATRDQA